MNELLPPRAKGSSRLARQAIAQFVESNIPRFDLWLEQIAGGIPQYDGRGEVMTTLDGSVIWLVRPNPAMAMKLVADICEYHLPRLSRSDVEVVAQVESRVATVATLETMPTVELRRLIQEKLAAIRVKPQADADIVDAEVVETPPLPAWITG